MAEDLGIRVGEAEVPWEEGTSPAGRYGFRVKAMSQRLRAAPRPMDGAGGGGRPFEVDLFALPPGRRRCPVHAHGAQWEYYIVLAGEGRLLFRGEDGREETLAIRAGDHVLQPPGWAHTVENTGTADLVYYVVASNPPAEVVHYPDSDKWMLHPGRAVFRMGRAEYYDGEE